MENKRIDLGNLDLGLHYVRLDGNTVGMIFRVFLKKRVNEASLRYAVQKTRERYLLLQMKIVEAGTETYFEENKNDFVIKNEAYELDKYLGKDCNDYPWEVSYYDNYIVFVCMHSLFDGVGILNVRKTILYYYFEKEGIVAESHDIKTLNDDISECLEQELEVGYKPNTVKTLFPFPEKPLLPPDFISQEHFIDRSERSRAYQFTIDDPNLIPLVKRYETTPFALMLPVFARSIRYLFDKSDPVISTETIVDIRPFTGIKTLRNSTYSAMIDYISGEMDAKPLDWIATVFRSILDVKINRDNIFAAMDKEDEFLESVFKTHSGTDLIAYILQYYLAYPASIVFSYGSRINLPAEFENEIESMQISGNNFSIPILVQMLSFKNTISFTIMTRLDDEAFTHNIIDEFAQLGIKCTCKRSEDIPRVFFS